MARSRLCTGNGDEKGVPPAGCKDPEAEGNKGSRKRKQAEDKNSPYYKEVRYVEKKQTPTQTKVEAKADVIETESGKKAGAEDVTIYKGSAKNYTGKLQDEASFKDKKYEGGNKKAGKYDMSKELETRFYKKRSKLGRKLTGEQYKQTGVKIESQTKEGEKEVLTFKGRGRKGRKWTEKGDVVEREKENYKAMEKKFEPKKILGELPQKEKGELESLTYKTKKIGTSDTDYKLGDKGEKQWKVAESTYKAAITEPRKENKDKSVRVRRKALSNQQKYGKA